MAEASPIGLRAQDAPDDSDTYVKAFVVPTSEAVFVDHEANEHATRLEMFQHGLRPTSDIAHRSAKDKPSAGSTTITYRCSAVLTSTEDDPSIVHQNVAGDVPVPAHEDDEDLNPEEPPKSPES